MSLISISYPLLKSSILGAFEQLYEGTSELYMYVAIKIAIIVLKYILATHDHCIVLYVLCSTPNIELCIRNHLTEICLVTTVWAFAASKFLF